MGGIHRRSFLGAIGGIVAPVGFGRARGQTTSLTVGLEPVTTTVNQPTAFESIPGTDAVLIGQLFGRVDRLSGGEVASEPLIDFKRDIVAGGESGLLGLAIHPDFPADNRVFVRYSDYRREGTPSSYAHTFVLAEFELSTDGSSIHRDSERTVLEIPQPQGNHNAGDIAFGPDGHLYVAVGDGGSLSDNGSGHVEDWYDGVPGGNGQDVTANLLGSILRLDVDATPTEHQRTDEDAPLKPTGPGGYAIPTDNPLVGREGLDEHYAWGLRNPWRISFDQGRLFVGDVGQSRFDEVNLVERGGNYGWNVREASHCFDAEECPTADPGGEPLRDSIVEYPHGDTGLAGIAVTGGYVYRGHTMPTLRGDYVFGDWQRSNVLFRARPPKREDDEWQASVLPIRESDHDKIAGLLSLGRDPGGELYVLSGDRQTHDGSIYRVVPEEQPTQTVSPTPTVTSPSTSAPSTTSTSTPAAGPGLGSLTGLGGLIWATGLAIWNRNR
jgi:glucose/arabinose dehydrogenase